MNLEQFKNQLEQLSEINFVKPDGSSIPKHFHITEIGEINKRFIDCGGVVRNESVIAMQLWESVDFWHRLEPKKLTEIIDLSIEKLEIGNHEIEIEYQDATIGKYSLDFKNGSFQLVSTKTACLASDSCGVTVEKIKKNLSELTAKVESCCSSNGNCC